jgi:hypothetical protein
MCVQAPAGHLLRLLGAYRIMLAAQLVLFSCLAALSLASERTFLFVLISLCIGAAQVNATFQCGCADLQVCTFIAAYITVCRLFCSQHLPRCGVAGHVACAIVRWR